MTRLRILAACWWFYFRPIALTVLLCAAVIYAENRW